MYLKLGLLGSQIGSWGGVETLSAKGNICVLLGPRLHWFSHKTMVWWQLLLVLPTACRISGSAVQGGAHYQGRQSCYWWGTVPQIPSIPITGILLHPRPHNSQLWWDMYICAGELWLLMPYVSLHHFSPSASYFSLNLAALLLIPTIDVHAWPHHSHEKCLILWLQY